MSASTFQQFRKNLAVANSDDISTSYGEITKRLNKDFWGSDSEVTHSLQVGSYGRQTAIRDVSDLDMVFELPKELYERLSQTEKGASQLLQDVRNSLREKYPRTEIKGDGQVVVVSFDKYVVEVLPAFPQEDGSYRFVDTNNGGTWNNFCWPREEMAEVNKMSTRTNRNLKYIAKMLRAWKNTHGVPMSGMLIDTLAYNFFKANTVYDDKSYGSHPYLIRDVFSYLADRPEQDYWLAPGSNSRVDPKGKFQGKAKKALELAEDALATDSDSKKHRFWGNIFGARFPSQGTVAKAQSTAYSGYKSTEEFIENIFPVDIQYEVEIGYDVMFQGAKEHQIIHRFMESKFFWLKLGRGLEFFVRTCNVPSPFKVMWKVRNVGEIAELRRQVRGEIVNDSGQLRRTERTSFGGPHFVECYVIKDNVCVARNRIDVPIEIS